jgi:cytochrome c peroxidase
MRASYQYQVFVVIARVWVATGCVVAAHCQAARDQPVTPAARIGARLFADLRFSQPFAADGERAKYAVSCGTCHIAAARESGRAATRIAHRTLTFADDAARSSIPPRGDARTITARNSPSLVEALMPNGESGLLHFDGEFSCAETLVKESFLGRNFGWLPGERAAAVRQFARVIREDNGLGTESDLSVPLAYALLLRGNDGAIPISWQIPPTLRIDPAQASDEAIVDACARLVVAFVRSLRFSRDAEGLFDGSPYDAFLAANQLARAPDPDQTLAEYGRRVGEQIAALRKPLFVDDSTRALRLHQQPFRFGELELQGARIFFRTAVGQAQKSGAGNCAECHVPPLFADFRFHNTGVAQDEYDAVHGSGAFARLDVPDAGARDADFDRWLPATPSHPNARGPFLFPATHEFPGRTDLGLWNVYANPDLFAPQREIERMLNPSRQLSRDDVLGRSLGRFKTSALRDLGQSAPYFHNGSAGSLEDVILFYQRISALVPAGQMRNAPPEFSAMRLSREDVAPLAAFLRSLNEDYPLNPSRSAHVGRSQHGSN